MILRCYLLALFICTWWLSGCDAETGFVGFTGEEYSRMLTGDSIKIWKKQQKRISGKALESDECLDLTILEFGYVDDNSENRYFEIKLDPNSCDGDSSVLQWGSWMLLLNSYDRLQTDTILFITRADTTMKWIGEISAFNLVLESDLDGEELIESYTLIEGIY